ncbi:16569_t:CDS:2 [Acaulospora morrowiae]|uniref:16569_t:CDS:1 n=1 Tax=Acaulospora morrowiae TaxID=94023 RepID=A0A9N9HNK9_9GLOM|nr:16569_t:CDS:2 [Acaulospora morrowiae]
MEEKPIENESVSRELAEHLNFSESNSSTLKDMQNGVRNVASQIEDIKQSLEHVRSDVDARSEVASKELYDAAHHLDALYDKIDSLERFINIVKQTVNEVTDAVDEAEGFLTNPINLVLDTIKLNTAKSIEVSDLRVPPMRPLNIYRTSDHFPDAPNAD